MAPEDVRHSEVSEAVQRRQGRLRRRPGRDGRAVVDPVVGLRGDPLHPGHIQPFVEGEDAVGVVPVLLFMAVMHGPSLQQRAVGGHLHGRGVLYAHHHARAFPVPDGEQRPVPGLEGQGRPVVGQAEVFLPQLLDPILPALQVGRPGLLAFLRVLQKFLLFLRRRLLQEPFDLLDHGLLGGPVFILVYGLAVKQTLIDRQPLLVCELSPLDPDQGEDALRQRPNGHVRCDVDLPRFRHEIALEPLRHLLLHRHGRRRCLLRLLYRLNELVGVLLLHRILLRRGLAGAENKQGQQKESCGSFHTDTSLLYS